MATTASDGPSSTNGKKVNLPTITLDMTLTDLYDKHCPSYSNTRIGHIFCGTNCAADMSPDFPRNKKYIYQDGAFNDAKRREKTDIEVTRILAPKYLSLIPQRDAFITGKAPVIFFYTSREQIDIEHDETETTRTLAQLGEAQRPETIFCQGPGYVSAACADHDINALEVKLIVDIIADPSAGIPRTTRMLIDPDLHYYLNAKEGLAKSGLPTPRTEIVEVQGCCPDPEGCCEACATAMSEEVPDACTGRRKRWIGEQIVRILSAVERQKLPFVFKNQQAFAGAGTYVVTKGPERNQLLQDMTTGGILRRLLCRITRENQYLCSGSVLLMEMVRDPVADYGLTFFVGEDGTPEFLAASEQMIDPSTASWIGSKISYLHQEDLKKKLGPLLDQIAAWLHKQGYFGPGGADFLETKDGDFQIVDLNIRTTGSLCLPLMRTHFQSRGFHCASSLSVTVKKTRNEFCEQWREDLESGQLCIVAWYEDRNAGVSFGDVMVGAEDEGALKEEIDKIRKFTDTVTF